MSDPLMKYKVRSGTVDSGKKYETKIAVLLSLRCVLSKEDMWISSNADGVGSLDDIILRQGNKTFMLQLKHKDDPKPILDREYINPKSDFYLKKYFQDIINLKKSIENKGAEKLQFINYLGKFENINFILYTNRDTKISEYLFEENNEGLLFLNTGQKIFKINPNKILDLEGEENDFKNCFLFPNQIHAKNLEKEIGEEIKKIAKEFKIKHLRVKTIVDNFSKFIKDWGDGLLGGHYCLKKSDIIWKLTEIFFSQYETKLNEKNFLGYKSKKKFIWNEIIQNQGVTLVDYDENTWEFLLKYLGSEVGKYFGFKYNYWRDVFSKEAQKEFYDKFKRLKGHMLKIIGNHGVVSLMDVYKSLWMDREIPLLLEINFLEQFEDILNIFKFAKFTPKLLIINKSQNLIFPTPIKYFKTLKDLNEKNRKLILSQETNLQGRSSIILGTLLEEEMLQHISCKDIIYILLERFSIGKNLTPLPEYFIPRSLSKIFLISKVLDEVPEEIFLLEETEEKKFLMLPVNNTNIHRLEELNVTNINNCGIILISNPKDMEKLKSIQKPLHHLIIHNENYLEWKNSTQSVRNLRSFQVDLDGFEIDLRKKFSNPINLVSGVPGMGKSILMDFIALQTPVTQWVLKINLNGHQNYFKSAKSAKVLEHLEYFNFYSSGALSDLVFKTLIKRKDVVVLFDGFDEVSLCYKKEVVDIAKNLLKEGFKVWITTRPHMKGFLESELQTFSLSLTSFTRGDQKNFLMNYFFPEEPTLRGNEFVEKLLSAAEKNLNDWDGDFTGIPLQTKLLADAFKENCLNENFDFNENFDLLFLYESFINKKIDILCKKFGPNAEDFRFTFKEHQSLFALKLLFSQHKNLLGYESLIKKLDNFFGNNPERIELLQREGVVIIDKEFNVNFVHRTFGEFLAAQWLAENLNSEFSQVLIKERFVTENYKFLFGIFDRILVKNLPLHLAILNKKEEDIWEIINSTPNSITKYDKGRRSILHLISLYSTPFPEKSSSDQGMKISPLQAKNILINQDKMFFILKKILLINHKLGFCKDCLGFTPLDYALSGGSLTIAEELSKKFNQTIINSNINLELKKFFLISSLILDYNFLFNLLLSYFASRELLLGKINKNEFIEGYVMKSLRDFSLSYKNQNYLILNFGIKNPILEKKTIFEVTYKTLTRTICLEPEEKIKGLLKLNFLELNQQDVDYNTPLHYAVIYKKIKTVELLLNKHVEVNKQNLNLDTPLHLALNNNTPLNEEKTLKKIFVNSKTDKIIKKLISKGADTNLKNKNNNTPLHLALKYNKQAWGKLFIEAGGDVEIQNQFGETALHIIATHGYNELLTPLFNKKKINVNLQDNKGQTPIFCAAQNNNLKIVEGLLLNSADITLPDKYGLTVLHLAASLGYNEILTVLLNKKNITFINIEDNHGQTPLFSAVRYNHIESVRLLLEKGANVNLKDKNGLTVFQRVAPLGYNEILGEILKKGCDINARNKNGETGLLCAGQCHKLSTVKFLINKGADVNISDNQGLTPYHFFARSGNTEILSLILNKNKKGINQKDNKGETPLILAAQNNHVDTIKLLLVNGADFNIQDKNNLTPLHLFASHGYLDILKVILSQGHDVKDNKGKTPLFYAAQNNYKKIVKLFLFHGADPWIKDKTNLTPFHLFASLGYVDILSTLLTNNPKNINLKDNKGQTAIFFAAQNNHIDVVKLLFSKGADIIIQDQDGLTPLHLFTLCGYTDILVTVLNSGMNIDIDVQDNKGRTPLFGAIENNHIDTVKLFLAHGADVSIKDKKGLTPFDFARCDYTNILSEGSNPEFNLEDELDRILGTCNYKETFPDES